MLMTPRCYRNTAVTVIMNYDYDNDDYEIVIIIIIARS